MIQHSRYDEIDQIGYFPRTVIEGWRGRHYDRARPCEPEHVAEVNRAQRRLAWNENELAALFERYIRRSFDQRPRSTDSDGGQRSHRAWADDHSRSARRSGRWRCTAIVVRK